MSSIGKSKSKAIHDRLGHPVIDSDGHWREFEPIALDYLKETAGAKVVEKWTSRLRALGEGEFSKMTKAEKIDRARVSRHGGRCRSRTRSTWRPLLSPA
jgi:hypothetical protein